MKQDNTDYFERLWSERVGSSRLSEEDELKQINFLNRSKKVTFAQARNLFYLTKFWKRMRAEALLRDQYKCIKCGKVDNLQVDHLQYRGLGNERLEDLQTLCVFCHRDKSTKAIEKARDILYTVTAKDELFMVMRRKHNG